MLTTAADLRRASTAVFAALVAATFAAFFLAQRLKHEPTLIQHLRTTRVFSPNGDGSKDTADVSFVVKRRDQVSVAVVDAAGDPVRDLFTRTTRRNSERVLGVWDGRDDSGRRVSDGLYRYQITLRGQGRNIVYPRGVRVDVTPPRPRVLSVGAAAARAAPAAILPLPNGARLPIVVDARGGLDLRVRVFRTAPAPAPVAQLPLPVPEDPATPRRRPHPVRVSWDGRVGGRPAPPGTYVVVAEAVDRAGNVGRSVRFGPAGRPQAPYGRRLRGRAGITVRYAGVEPPAVPASAGSVATIGIDMRGRPYRWSLRRIDVRGAERVGRRARGGAQRFLIPPARNSGVYLLRAAGERGAAKAPVAVQGTHHRRVLVVLPVMTWQGRNPVDDDGDGEPNLLEHGDTVRLHRVYAGLPATFSTVTEPLLRWIGQARKHYDITTDLALARGGAAALRGHRGVLVAGDMRWMPAAAQQALRRYVQASGTVATIGVDNLRRLVRLTTGDVLIEPTPPAAFDALGLRPGRLLGGDVTLTNAKDEVGLFHGTSGQFTGLSPIEPLLDVRGGTLVASAVTPDDRAVIAAVRMGRGLIIHLGAPTLASRALHDPQTAALLQSTWMLLSR